MLCISFLPSLQKKSSVVKVELWFGNRLGLATLRTGLTHIENMMVGVTKGFLFKMKYVYAHFPINLVVSDNQKVVEVRNFLVSRHNEKTRSSRTQSPTRDRGIAVARPSDRCPSNGPHCFALVLTSLSLYFLPACRLFVFFLRVRSRTAS